MIVLGIDTSAKTCSVAVLRDGICLFSQLFDGGLTHSQTLLPLIKNALHKSGVTVSQLDLISITSGPGSFTGLRIGISTVKGLAFADRIPCIGVSTLEACAENAVPYEEYTVCTLMDARRGEFYNAFFQIKNGSIVRLTEDRAISGAAITEELKEHSKIILLGDGAEKFSAMFPEFAEFLSPGDIRYQCGYGAALLGVKNYEAGLSTTVEKLSPVYLRLPQAEREWQAKNNNLCEVRK